MEKPLRIACMRPICFATLVLTVCVGLVGYIPPHTASGAAPVATATERPLWTTSQIHGTPDPPDPYHTVVAYPRVRLQEPLAIELVSDLRRFVVAERHGKVFTFLDRAEATPDLLIDVERTVYGVTVHPQFARNGYLFVTTIVKQGNEEISRLSRFVVDRESWRADRSSELTIIEWPAGGHNGGCIHFGPDGYLYLSCGDGSGWGDWFATGQRVDDLLSSLLRIDVDRPSDGRAYSIPTDNPFVNTPAARPEVWSLGHRQVWKFSFDQKGRLWAGDVGQDLWEMIYHIEKGSNHGWSVMESAHPFRPERPVGPAPIRQPLVEHSHADFRSITGGGVYDAEDIPDLHGCYIYGDFDTGKLWALRYEGGKVRDQRQLADTPLRIIDFVHDSEGRVLVLDFSSGTLSRIAPAPPITTAEQPFPRRLSEAGLFASTREHTPADGLIPYDVNAPLWSDGASKQRFLALPGAACIEFDAVTYPMPAPGWRFPDGTVLVKTFSMELETGNPASARRLETRILHHKRMPGKEHEYGAQVWRGYTYVWNDEQTDAELLDASGRDTVLTIRERDGTTRQQTWHFPSRAECTLCHTMSAKYVLGVNTVQMNRNYDYAHGTANQLEQLERWGVFTAKPPQSPEQLPRLSSPDDGHEPLENRARAYLHANCSHCHRLWGGGLADFQLQFDLSLDKTGVLNTPATRGGFDLQQPAIVVPGQPDRSVLLHRMQRLGPGRMPHVASSIVDASGVELIDAWIRSLPP